MYNMSDSQKSIFYIEKVYPHTGICNIGGLLHFGPEYDADILKLCCKNIIKSNSSFWIKVAGTGKIYFEQPEYIDMPEYDFSDYDEEKEKGILSGWMEEPLYDTDKHLFDIRMVRKAYFTGIFVKVHHLIADGFSVALFTKKMTEIHNDILSGCYEYSEDTSYMDKIIKENDCAVSVVGEANNKAGSLFGEKANNPKAGLLHRNFEVADATLKVFLKSKRTSTEILIYAAVAKYMSVVHNSEVIHIGRNLANRSGEEYKSIGMYVRTAGFTFDPSEYESADNIDEYLKKIRQDLKMTVSGDAVSDNQAFDIIMSYRPYKLMESIPDGECIEIYNGFSEVPLKLFVKETAEGISIDYIYQKEIFADKDIVRLADRIEHIIRQIVNEEASKMSEITVYNDADKALISRFNDTKRPVQTKSLLEKFEENVLRFPDKIALIYENEHYSYKETYDRVCKLALWLRQNVCAGKEKIVAVSLARSMWNPIALYAIWKAGYAYLPVSIHNSAERNNAIYEKCAAVIDEKVIAEIECRDAVNTEYESTQNEIAYYMFTSGTTGEPKAVAISHASLNERVSWMADTFSAGTDIIMHKTNNSFDVSMWELALAFAYGKALCVARERKEKNPQALAELINRENVTMIHFVPSMFQAFVKYTESNGCKLDSLKYIILSGERLDSALVKKAVKLFDNAKVYNLYGPTECTIDVSCYECRGNEEIIPIGTPVWNTELLVCNKKGEILPVGERGELVVKGSLLGEYSDIFSENISGGFENISGEKCYFTGDIASLSEDGYMYFHGRKDSQTKIRGMRINLSELEEVLNNSFEDCTHVLVHESDKLIDFYEGEIPVSDIEKIIEERFQYYYKPSAIIKVDRLPVKENGKIDKDALLDRYYSERVQKPVEKTEDDVWEIDRITNILIRCAEKYVTGSMAGSDNLVHKGMDSLSSINYMLDLEQFGLKTSYEMLIKAKNIRELAEYIYNYSGNKNDELVYLNSQSADELILAVPFAGGTPLSFVGLYDAIDKKKYDLAVVNTAFFKEESVIDISRKICEKLAEKNYNKIHIISSCVGSSIAIDICSRLSGQTANLILCETLPYTGMRLFGKMYSVWDMLPGFAVEKILQLIRRKPLKMDAQMLLQFRRDVKKSAEWLRNTKPVEITCPVSVIYGTKDLLTKGYNHKYKKWRKYIQTQDEIKVYEIENAGHFLVEDYAIKLSEINDKNFYACEYAKLYD